MLYPKARSRAALTVPPNATLIPGNTGIWISVSPPADSATSGKSISIRSASPPKKSDSTCPGSCRIGIRKAAPSIISCRMSCPPPTPSQSPPVRPLTTVPSVLPTVTRSRSASAISKARSRISAPSPSAKSPKFRPASDRFASVRKSAQPTTVWARSMKSSIAPRSSVSFARCSRSSRLILPSPVRSRRFSQSGISLSILISAVITSSAMRTGSSRGSIASKTGSMTSSRNVPRSSVTSRRATVGRPPKLAFWSDGLTEAFRKSQPTSSVAETEGKAPLPKSADRSRTTSELPVAVASRKSAPSSDSRNLPSLLASVR